MTPKTVKELHELIDDIGQEFADWDARHGDGTDSLGVFLCQRLAAAGVQMVPMPDKGAVARMMVELSPFYTEQKP